jgi:hypothetical protein
MVEWISGKVEYTEEEAASVLGVSIGELRALVRTHVTKDDADREEAEIPLPTFRPSDILLLKMLSGSRTEHTRATAE